MFDSHLIVNSVRVVYHFMESRLLFVQTLFYLPKNSGEGLHLTSNGKFLLL